MAYDLIIMVSNKMDQASVAENISRRITLTGRADSFSFPESEEDVECIICEMAETKPHAHDNTGRQDGITGGAVPTAGHVINCSRMKKIQGISRNDADGSFLVEAQAGLSLAEFNEMIVKGKYVSQSMPRYRKDGF